MEIETHVHERKRENRAARCDRLTLFRSVRKGGGGGGRGKRGEIESLLSYINSRAEKLLIRVRVTSGTSGEKYICRRREI